MLLTIIVGMPKAVSKAIDYDKYIANKSLELSQLFVGRGPARGRSPEVRITGD